MKKLIIPIFFIIYCLSSTLSASPIQEVRNTQLKWAIAIRSQDPQQIAGLYDKNAFVFPTFKNSLTNQEEVLNYFKDLTKRKDLNVDFTEHHLRIFHETAIDSGVYVFSYRENGKTVRIPARFTFVYALEPGRGWKIVEHHSSVMPEQK